MWKIILKNLYTVCLFTFFVIINKQIFSLSNRDNKVLSIGIVGALSGNKALYGISHLNGAQLAVDKINKAGGINGIKLKLIPMDDEGDMAKASTIAVELITNRNVIALIGSVDSGVTHVLAMIAVKLHVPHITCVATDPSLTRAGSPWTFRTLADDELQTKALINKLMKFDIHHISVLAGSTRYGRIGAITFVRNCNQISKQLSKNVLVEGPFYLTLNESNNEQIIKMSLNNNPQALILWMLAHEAENTCNILKKLNFRGIIAGGDGLASYKFYNQILNCKFQKVIITCPYLDESTTPENLSFRSQYYSMFASYPDSFAAHAYDTVNLIAHSLKNIPNLQNLSITDVRNELKKALSNIKDFYGVNGKIELDESNNYNQKVLIIEIINGKPKLLE